MDDGLVRTRSYGNVGVFQGVPQLQRGGVIHASGEGSFRDATRCGSSPENVFRTRLFIWHSIGFLDLRADRFEISACQGRYVTAGRFDLHFLG
ncbi:hypothetical protein [Streptomyces sp. GbtcB6]|uniref:hypothetical protein n=1 Tax=Streptomyces sp. GbtcB6 TaxID=2824751 RepID=UPI001C2FD401|nr:hypothetical protein [Streptomyces sp. GbtcB6]